MSTVTGGIVNGSTGVLKKIRYQLNANGERTLTSCVIALDDEEPCLPDMARNEAPVISDTKSFFITHPITGRKCSIRRHQVPIQPAYAITAHRAQGQTYTHVVVDLQNAMSIEAAYVMLSRATNLNGILILRPFNFRRIHQPSRDTDRMRDADRLKVLSLQTTVRMSTAGSPEHTHALQALLALHQPSASTPPLWTLDSAQRLDIVRARHPCPPQKRKFASVTTSYKRLRQR